MHLNHALSRPAHSGDPWANYDPVTESTAEPAWYIEQAVAIDRLIRDEQKFKDEVAPEMFSRPATEHDFWLLIKAHRRGNFAEALNILCRITQVAEEVAGELI